MLALIAAVVLSVGFALFMWSSYSGHIEDLRYMLEYERERRRAEEARADRLRDALYGRTQAHNDKTTWN